jgi:glycosyltransferase involved in cell wall biosynthesis
VNASQQDWMHAFAQLAVPVLIVHAKGGYSSHLVEESGLEFFDLPHWGAARMTLIPRGLARVIREGDLVYLHEGWTLSNVVAALICRLKRIPYIIMPHGVYEPKIVDGLRLKGARLIAERMVARNALAVHVFFPEEEIDIRHLLGAVRTFAVATGYDVPVLERKQDGPGRPYLAWLGRYDIEHKGIDRLLLALSTVPEERRPMVVMHGPDHRGDRVRTLAMVRSYGLEHSVTVAEELAPEEARRFLRDAAAFVHFARWEAFGRTIVEALAQEAPVLLASDARIAQYLGSAGVATIFDASQPREVGRVLEEAARTPSMMRPAGRTWIEENLSWESRVAAVRAALRGSVEFYTPGQ